MNTSVSDKAFISYSRRDKEFLEWLIERLTSEKVEVSYDVRDIEPAEDWQQRLSCLIREGEAFICIFSMHYQKSKICQWELEEAIYNNKKIIPCAYDKNQLNTQINPALSRLNFVLFDDPLQTEQAVSKLVVALKLDVVWMREHTRLQMVAFRWDECGRPEYMLLNASELEEVDRWLDNKSSFSSEITDLQAELFRKSRYKNQQIARNLDNQVRSACKLVLTSQSMLQTSVKEADVLAVLESNHFLNGDVITSPDLPRDALVAAALTLVEISALTRNTEVERSIKAAWRALNVFKTIYESRLGDYFALNNQCVCIDRLGDALFAHGKHKDALKLYRRGLHIARKWKRAHKNSCYTLNVLDTICVFAEKIADSLQVFDKSRLALIAYRYALQHRRPPKQDQIGHISDRYLNVVYEKIAKLYLSIKDFHQAMHFIIKAHDVVVNITAAYPNHLGLQRDYLITLENMSDLYRACNDAGRAIKYIDASLSIIDRLTIFDPTNFAWQGDLCRVSSKYIVANRMLEADSASKSNLLKPRNVFDRLTNEFRRINDSSLDWVSYIGFTQTIASYFRRAGSSADALVISLQAIETVKIARLSNNISQLALKSFANTLNNASWYCMLENLPDQAFLLSEMSIKIDPEDPSLWVNYFLACVANDRHGTAFEVWRKSESLCSALGKNWSGMIDADLEELSNEICVLPEYIEKINNWLDKFANRK